MRRYASLTALFVFMSVNICLSAQISANDVCYEMAANSLRDITVSQTSDASISALYSNYCHADGTVNNGSINTAGSAIVDAIPINVSFKGQTATQRFTQFCKQYQSYASVSNNAFNYSNMVYGKALTSVNECLKAAAAQFALSYKTLTPATLAVNFTIPGGQSLTVNGVHPDSGVTCTGHDYTGAGGAINYTPATQQTISSNAGAAAIVCSRAPDSTNNGQQFYSAKAVVVVTNAGSLDIYWPQDSAFPITTASTIQTNINSLQSSVSQLQEALSLNALPIGAILPWFSQAAVPKGWALCDGNTPGVPNLKHVFLRGAAGDFGGASGAEMHNHYSGAYVQGTTNLVANGNGFNSGGKNYQVNINPASNLPPYLNVNFIMKVN